MRLVFLTILMGALVSGCASGVAVKDAPEATAPPARGQSRIVVYRDGVMGAAVQPTVRVNGRETGTCTPNSAFFVDLEPGTHEVSAKTEVTRSTQVKAEANQTHYVKCSINMGFLVGRPNLAQIVSSSAQAEVAPLVFKGKY